MGFVALIFALLIEQGRPLPGDNPVHRAAVGLADVVRGASDAGERQHGVFGWIVVVGAGVIGVAALSWLAGLLHPLALFVVHVAVLYLTVGFRHFSHAFTEIQVALASDDADGARRVLDRWLNDADPDDLADRPRRETPVNEVCRQAIAHALVAAHRHVFGPLFWYILLPGVIGPVLYRIAEMLARRWGGAVAEGAARVEEPYGHFALRAYRALDWLPARLSAAGFAIVGNFEDAVYCWRGAVAARTTDDQRALLLASGGGALGVRVAEPALEARWAAGEQGFEWQGAEPDASALRSAVGLVWRSVVLWISLFAMLTIAAWLGR
ncbi:MAG: CobD/CbiB family protein [Burkholderiales bacterium]|nr:MAG: CobD/CbiB family protein [Burkholderiales bacterium]